MVPVCPEVSSCGTVAYSHPVKITMNTESSEEQTAPTLRTTTESRSLLGVALFVGLLVVSLPFLMMSTMMVGMAWMDPAMHGGMDVPAAGVFPVVGLLGFVVLGGVFYGVFRLLSVPDVRH